MPGQGSGNIARAEQSQRHQRIRHTCLADKKRSEQPDRDRAECERLGRSPALLRDPENRVHAEHQTDGQQRSAGEIGPGGETDSISIGDQPDREQRGRKPDRQVDEEDPMPVERLREHAARALRRGHCRLPGTALIFPRTTTPWLRRCVLEQEARQLRVVEAAGGAVGLGHPSVLIHKKALGSAPRSSSSCASPASAKHECVT